MSAADAGRLGRPPPSDLVPAAWRRFAAASPALAATGLALLATSLLLLVPMAVDPRQWQGVSTWLKPWKFHVSIALQLLTMALFAHAVAAEARRGAVFRGLVGVALATGLFEAAYITLMGGLNQGSHFNVASPLPAAMYTLMGVAAVALAASGAALGVLVAKAPRPGLAPALRYGLALALIGGFLLGTWSGAQIAGRTSHGVGGVASDAGGLPLFGWSTRAGDLRIAHFFGIHATQAIAGVAWLALRAVPRPAPTASGAGDRRREGRGPAASRRSIVVTTAFALGWAALVVWLHARAAAGQPPWASL